MRIRWQPREKAAYIKLRRKGHSIQDLQMLFNRSTSVIHRALKRVGMTGYTWVGAGYFIGRAINKFDLRKSSRYRAKWAHRKGLDPWAILMGWQQFAKGEVDEPP